VLNKVGVKVMDPLLTKDNNMEITDQTVKDAIHATMQGMIKWIASDYVIIQDKRTKEILHNAEIESINGIGPMDGFIIPELLKHGIIYNTEK